MPIFQVDAFTDQLFGGNPAAIVPLTAWPDASVMQQVAMENNLAETAFYCPVPNTRDQFDIRWFTPALEIDLCGHATLAAAWVIRHIFGYTEPLVRFHSKSGELTVGTDGTRGVLNFPARMPDLLLDYPEQVLKGLRIAQPVAVYKSRDYLVELESEKELLALQPDFTLLGELDVIGFIVTAPGKEADFVSRFFAPRAGINEDPVTGSAHSTLIPFWAEKLGKKKLLAKQVSQRGGTLWCEMLDNSRVHMAGECVLYMKGEIYLP